MNMYFYSTGICIICDSSVFFKTKMEEKLERLENDCLSAFLEVSLASRKQKQNKKKRQDLRSCVWFEDRRRHVFWFEDQNWT